MNKKKPFIMVFEIQDFEKYDLQSDFVLNVSDTTYIVPFLYLIYYYFLHELIVLIQSSQSHLKSHG